MTMRILLDECIDVSFRKEIVGFRVETAKSAGLLGLKNGALMQAITGNFDALVITDKGLPHQQNVPALPFAVIVLRAKSNRIEDLKPLVPDLVATLAVA